VNESRNGSRWRSFLGPLSLAALVLFTLWLHWPSLRAGVLADDFLQRAMLDGTYPIHRAPWDLYSFFRNRDEMPALMANGVLPWWMPPDLRLSLLRPLPSLLVWLDYKVLALSPVGEHVHSLLWLAAFIVAFGLLARRILPRGAAYLATALAAFDLALVSPVAWLCNRAPMVTATFGALALYGYHRHREDGSRAGAAIAFAGFSLALAGGEYAIGVLAFVFAYELVAARDSIARRLRGAALVFVPAAVYAIVYVSGHYGASGGTVYIGPLDSPRMFAASALLRVPSLLASELFLLPGEAVYLALLIRSPLALLAFLPMIGVGYALALTLRDADGPLRRRIGAYALGVGLGLVPLSGTIPAVRLLLVPSIGGSLVLAALIWAALGRARSPGQRRRVSSWIFAAVALPLAVLHLGLAPWFDRAYAETFAATAARLRQACYDSEIDDRKVANQDLVLLNIPADLVALDYPVWVRHAHGSPMPKSWRTLTSALVPLRVIRVDDSTLDLAVEKPGDAMFGYDERRHENPDQPFRVGQRVSTDRLDVEVLEVHGWAPSRVRYRFPSSLDDPSREFLRYEHGRLVRFVVPPVGGEAPLSVGFP
jgi:hypothetical protein